jgi:hypothetical protein
MVEGLLIVIWTEYDSSEWCMIKLFIIGSTEYLFLVRQRWTESESISEMLRSLGYRTMDKAQEPSKPE